VLEIREVNDADEEEEEVTTPHDIFEVFAAEKKKHDSRLSKVPKLTTPYNRYQAANTGSACTQFKYQSNAKDHHLVSKLEDYLMQGKLSLTTLAHIFAASPIIHKDIVEKLRLQQVENDKPEVN